VSGVSTHCEIGLGLPEKKPSLKVFLPFFIQAVLPHHIKRGEILSLDIVIFNYLSKAQTVTVSVKRNDQEFAIQDSAFDGWTGEQKSKLFSFILHSNTLQ
jgi:CD109 antigen